jgi:hypothetical protein
MSDFKTRFHYQKGVLKNTPTKELELPKVLRNREIVPIAAIVSGIELAMADLAKTYEVDGTIYAEADSGKLIMDYSISPKEVVPQLEAAIKKYYLHVERK